MNNPHFLAQLGPHPSVIASKRKETERGVQVVGFYVAHQTV